MLRPFLQKADGRSTPLRQRQRDAIPKYEVSVSHR